MIRNTKGLSAVVTTLIIILLVLVAVGIIWVVVNNVLESGAEQTEISAKCLKADAEITAVTCEDVTGLCNVTVQRGTGSENPDGIRVVVTDGSNSNSTDLEFAEESPFESLQYKTIELSTGDAVAADVTSVTVATYFKNAAGQPQLCAVTDSFSDISHITA